MYTISMRDYTSDLSPRHPCSSPRPQALCRGFELNKKSRAGAEQARDFESHRRGDHGSEWEQGEDRTQHAQPRQPITTALLVKRSGIILEVAEQLLHVGRPEVRQIKLPTHFPHESVKLPSRRVCGASVIRRFAERSTEFFFSFLYCLPCDPSLSSFLHSEGGAIQGPAVSSQPLRFPQQLPDKFAASQNNPTVTVRLARPVEMRKPGIDPTAAGTDFRHLTFPRV